MGISVCQVAKYMSIEICKRCTMAVDTDNITMEEHDADCVCQEEE